MPLAQKIDEDLKAAMIAKDAARLSALRMLKSALKYGAIEKKQDALGDADAQQVIQKQIKQRRESIDQFTKNGRPELAETEAQEVRVLEEYLPKQISDADLSRIAAEEVKAQGASTKKDFGRMMKHMNEKLQGAADSKRISEALGKLLP
ncbi:MAG TPA: GatB/YqeY domain-containing protein [Candidatus Eisenbacteria bacterium]|jgi:uncharacterized protein YqeY|nr:GatB/YqeY domain-containing protein [Candidatus Eisenbacteria bacterium]